MNRFYSNKQNCNKQTFNDCANVQKSNCGFGYYYLLGATGPTGLAGLQGIQGEVGPTGHPEEFLAMPIFMH